MAISRAQTASTVRKAPSSRRRKSKIPKKYLAGLSAEDKAKRKKEIERNRKKSASDPTAYNFPTDKTKSGKRRKTKESKHTKAFRKKFGKTRKS